MHVTNTAKIRFDGRDFGANPTIQAVTLEDLGTQQLRPVVESEWRATQVNSTTNLDASDQAIVDLNGLQTMRNLTRLRLDGNAVTNQQLVNLAGLRRLQKLDLSKNRLIFDISSLAGLSQLEYLDLQITSVNPTDTETINILAGLPNLKTLYLPFDGSIPSNTNLIVEEGTPVTINGVQFPPSAEGTYVHDFGGISIPIFVRNTSPTITAVPTLSNVNEGQTLTLGAPNITTDYKVPILADGVSQGDISIGDSSFDLGGLVTSVSITDPQGRRTDLSNSAASFTGDPLWIPSRSIDGATNLTVSLWMKTSGTGTQTILNAQGSLSGEEFALELVNDTTLRLTIQGDTVQWTIPSVADGNYRFVAITRDLANGEARLVMLNHLGQPVNVTSPAQSLSAGQRPLDLYTSLFSVGQNFVGTMDELTIWKRVLSEESETQVDLKDVSRSEYATTHLDLLGYWPLNEGAGQIAADATRFGNNGFFGELSGPVAYYKLDEQSGTTAYDSSGRGHRGTIQGNPTLGQSVTNPILGSETAAQFDGSGDRIVVPYHRDFNAPSYTMAGWFNPDSNFVGHTDIAAGTYFNSGSTQITGYGIYAQNGRWIHWMGNGIQQASNITRNTSIVANQWIHLVATFQAMTGPDSAGIYTGAMSFYADGQLVETKLNQQYKPSFSGRDLGIGGIPSNGSVFDGSIDEFRVYDRAMSPFEVDNLYNNSAPGDPQWTSSVPSEVQNELKFDDEYDGNDFVLTVTASDGDGGTFTSESTFTVNNVAPVINDQNPNTTQLHSSGFFVTTEIGKTLTFDARDVMDAGVQDELTYLWEVNTNNGEAIASGSDVDFSFTPRYSGDYQVSLTVTDDDGGQHVYPDVTDGAQIATSVFRVTPTAAISGSANAFAGTVVTLGSENSSRPPLGLLRDTASVVTQEHSWEVKLDGNTIATTDSPTLRFLPRTAGLYTATLTVTDRFPDGATPAGSTSFDVTVAPATPITITQQPQSALEGDTLTFSLSGLSQLGDEDDRVLNWSVTPDTYEIIPSADSETLMIRATADGTYSVSVNVTEQLTTSKPTHILVAAYEFDTADASDSSGNNSDGTINGGVQFVEAVGRPGRVAQFDGIDDFVETPIPFLSDITISMWVNTSQAAVSGTQWTDGFGLLDASVAGSSSDFGTSVVDGRFAFGTGATDIVGNPVADVTAISTTPINDGKWHHVVATRDFLTGNTLVYVDGVLEDSQVSQNLSPNVFNGASRMTIGQLQTNNNHYEGMIDDILVYERALSAAEVGQLFTSVERSASLNTMVDNAAPRLRVGNLAGSENSPVTLTVGVDDPGERRRESIWLQDRLG